MTCTKRSDSTNPGPRYSQALGTTPSAICQGSSQPRRVAEAPPDTPRDRRDGQRCKKLRGTLATPPLRPSPVKWWSACSGKLDLADAELRVRAEYIERLEADLLGLETRLASEPSVKIRGYVARKVLGPTLSRRLVKLSKRHRTGR